MRKPEPHEKALLVATCLAGVLGSPEAWRDYEHEAGNRSFDPGADAAQSFEDWAIRRADRMARKIWVASHQGAQ